MRFSNTFLDEIRDRVPISAVIGTRVSWDRRKTNASRGDFWACCPFHGEKSPSFHCEDRKGRYHCFGCGVSGDHFRFLTDLEGLNFPEAVERVADMAGVPMPKPDVQAAQRERERMGLIDVMEMAASYFQEQLQSAAGAKARAYLRERGLSGRTIETFRLGFALDSRNALKEYLAGKGVPKDQIEACGLVRHGEDIPVSYDYFRDRIMFPILSSREKVIAFGGRAMAPDAMAKYMNSPETELFHKGNVLYNFARARRAGQKPGGATDLIVVEGYMDVIALAQAGIGNAVAPLGTALTESQLDLLWKITPQPALCFDGDGAGLRAAYRAVELALPRIAPGRTLSFALLPDGKDPDDLVRHDGRAPFDQVMAEARPLADMVWQREITQGGELDTPEKRAGLEARLKQAVAVIADENLKRHYLQDIRDRLYRFFQAPVAEPGWRQGGGGGQGRGRGNQPFPGRGPARSPGVSERLARSGLVKGHRDQPALREAVLALTIVNQPQLLQEEYDEVAAIDFENRDLQRLWGALLTVFAADGAVVRDELVRRLEEDGFADFLKMLDRQVRNTRLWTATEQAAAEDAREAFIQSASLHKRAKALVRQRQELERDIAEATETDDDAGIERALAALREVQTEITRMENQEAIIEGFGIMSGRVKGAAVGHTS